LVANRVKLLAHIDATIKLLDPEFKVETIRPITKPAISALSERRPGPSIGVDRGCAQALDPLARVHCMVPDFPIT
jgi:hypothetical protein